jgi:hypothetical protein
MLSMLGINTDELTHLGLTLIMGCFLVRVKANHDNDDEGILNQIKERRFLT